MASGNPDMKIPPVLLLSCSLIGGSLMMASSQAPSPKVTPHREPTPHAKFDPTVIERDIAFHQGRVKRDPQGAIGWAMLAEAYLAESREYDRDTAAWKAEDAARKSLGIRTRGNERAKGALIASLLEQHRFRDALAALDAFGVKQGRLRADVLIEMGRYAEAKKLLLVVRSDDPSRYASLARIDMLTNRPKSALHQLQVAQSMLVGNAGISEMTLGWYDVKLGDAAVATGQRAVGRRFYESAIARHPRSYKAHLAMARLEFGLGNYPAAIRAGQATMKIANSLDARSIIGDAYAKQGNRREAQRWYASCREQFQEEVATFDRLKKGGRLRVRPIDRQFATFAATHRIYQSEALPAARRDLANRPDPHAHATVALLRRNS